MKKILIYGDSNTYGYDPRSALGDRYDENHRWPDLLAKRYADRYAFSVDGMNGRTIPVSPFGQGAVDKWIRRELPVDLFCVMLGSNDYLTMSAPDPRQVAWKMEKFLKHLLHTKADKLEAGNILLMAPPDMRLKDIPYYGRYDTVDGRLSYAMQELAYELGVRYFDAGEWDIPLAHDMVHFSEEGHLVFAEIMAREIFERGF